MRIEIVVMVASLGVALAACTEHEGSSEGPSDVCAGDGCALVPIGPGPGPADAGATDGTTTDILSSDAVDSNADDAIESDTADGAARPDIVSSDAGDTSDPGDGNGSDGQDKPDVPIVPDATPSACAVIFQCVTTTCGEDDGDCGAECMADASPEAVELAGALFACAETHKAECDEGPCVFSVCAEPFFACVDNGEVEGTLGCGDGVECVDGCELNEDEASGDEFLCISVCYSQLKDEDKPKLAGWANCFLKPGPGELEACIEAGLACFGLEIGGSGTCVDVFTCMDYCETTEEGGPACIIPCFAGIDSEQATHALTMLDCFWASEDDGEGDEGGDPFAACFDHVIACADPSGAEDCGGILACAEACEGEELSCMLKCFHQGSQAGVDAFSAMSACPGECEKICGEDEECAGECFMSQCGPLFEQCGF